MRLKYPKLHLPKRQGFMHSFRRSVHTVRLGVFLSLFVRNGFDVRLALVDLFRRLKYRAPVVEHGEGDVLPFAEGDQVVACLCEQEVCGPCQCYGSCGGVWPAAP